MQKELVLNLNNKILILIVISAALTLTGMFELGYAQEMENIEIEIKYTNGDRADFNGMEIIAYQDFDKTPLFKKILKQNPTTITVPENHRYKIEVYANGMYADVGYVQLNKNPEKLNINIPLSGGIEIGVFYKNGNPIKGATVVLKSQDNVEWIKGTTNDLGETIRYWVQSTNRQEDHYIADIYLGEIFLTSFYPIKLQPGISFDQKITTKIPEIVEELLIINLYSGSSKITSNDGYYKVTLNDLNGNKITSSEINFRGDAQFSSLKSGTYVVKITTHSELEDTLWPQNKIHVIGDLNKFNIYKNVQEVKIQETPFMSCNCISFRLDDVQDYWLSETQVKLIELFAEKNIPLTIGVIGSVTGSDNKLTTTIKNNLESEIIEIANHSWDNQILTSKSFQMQEKLIKDTNNKIFDIYGVKPTVFIPPQNLYDKNTVNVLRENNFSHLVSHIKDDSQTYINNQFYNVPATAETGKLVERIYWDLISQDAIKEKIIQNLEHRGYSIIMLHPQEFSLDESGEYGGPNQKALSEFGLLLDEIKKIDSKIVKISDVKPSENISNKTIIQEGKKADSCNCVAFRLDGVQDYWLNDVQMDIMNVFFKNNTPLTIGIIADALGNDKKITDFLNNNIEKSGSSIEIATKGIGLTPYTNYNKTEQNQNLKKSIELIQSIVGVKPHIFIPPDNKINSDTLEILQNNEITHISASLINESSPPFNLKGEKVYRFPQTSSTGNFNQTTNVFEGKLSDQVIQEIIQSIDNYGFAVVSIQPQEFSKIVNGTYTNKVSEKQIDELIKLIKELEKEKIKIVSIGKINSNVEIIVPEWIKNNAGWWADGSIDDNSFVQGIQYLIKEGIMKIPEKVNTSNVEEKEIPSWIKNNAGWWANDQITDSDFVSGIEYLVNHKIITY